VFRMLLRESGSGQHQDEGKQGQNAAMHSQPPANREMG
jgi:hypothetical protein